MKIIEFIDKTWSMLDKLSRIIYSIPIGKFVLYHSNKILDVSRLNNPLPIILLFLPCTWGLFLAYNKQISTFAMIYALLIFLIGSIAGRSIGCIINDIIDRDIDKQVERTKDRAIASGRISIKYGIFVAILWSMIGLYCFLKLNTIAKLFIILGMALSVIYPYTKRFFSMPQLVLGLAFNIGIFVGYSAVYNTIVDILFPLYVIGIYLTMFYDTIYAISDIEDDKRLGINSTAVKYEDKLMLYLIKCVIIITGMSIFLGVMAKMPWQYYGFIPAIFLEMIYILMLLFRGIKAPQYCFYRCISIGVMISIQILIGVCNRG